VQEQVAHKGRRWFCRPPDSIPDTDDSDGIAPAGERNFDGSLADEFAHCFRSINVTASRLQLRPAQRAYRARVRSQIDVTPAPILVAMRGNLFRENAQTPKFARRRLMRSSHMTVVIPNLDEIIR
jgi:hypothetical protein